MDLEKNLFDLYWDLISCSYRHGSYHEFFVSDPKPRKIAKATVRDRVVHHLVSKKLEEIYEPCFIYDVYSSRKGKGTYRAVKRLQERLNIAGGCRGDPLQSGGQALGRPEFRAIHRIAPTKYRPIVIKCDIKKFFASIDHEVLIRILEEKVKDEKFMGLIKKIIYSFPVETQSFASLRRGVPLGNVTSQIFANIYLNELDQFAKHRLKIKNYMRYCDDFLIANYANLSELSQIKSFIENKLKLFLHPNKTIIRNPSQGIDFLGYVIFPDHIVLRTKTKKRIFKNVEEEFVAPEKINSYFALLKHCESYKIRLEVCKKICIVKAFDKIKKHRI